MSSTDTIFALATPPGKSGVAVVRVSGDRAVAVLKQLCGTDVPVPRYARYVTLYTATTRQVLDRGLAIYFPAPHSFTGEDVVEFQLHGSLAVIRSLFSLLAEMEGVRPAERGEFTRRAFINGKIDLIQAEGLADLIDAQTQEQSTQAMRQMQGELSGFYETLRTGIIRALAHLEAYIDFPDEEIPESVLSLLRSDLMRLQRDIREALDDKGRGERVRDGIYVAILGAPNAGKSSLLNAMAKRDVAIVSTKAGTTRDVIEVHLDMAGYPIVLLDTAGIRDSDEDIESEGIRRALQHAESADIKLVLFDGASWPDINKASEALLDSRAIAVVTKADTLTSVDITLPGWGAPPLAISTTTGQGLDRLIQVLEARIISDFSGEGASLITRQRHRGLLNYALNHIDKSLSNAPLELACEELRLAAQAIGKITGKIQVDDVLDVIFSSFCIGK